VASAWSIFPFHAMTCPSFSGIELLSAFQLLRKLLIFTLPKRKRGLMSRARYNGEKCTRAKN